MRSEEGKGGGQVGMGRFFRVRGKGRSNRMAPRMEGKGLLKFLFYPRILQKEKGGEGTDGRISSSNTTGKKGDAILITPF